jgi:hypothetical protein
MRAQRRLGPALTWPRLTPAFLIDVAALKLGSHLPGAPQTVAWWVGVAVAAAVTIAAVLTYRGITVASALARWVWDWSADLWDSSPDPEATLSPRRTPAIDHRRRFGRDVVGVREYQGQLVAVIAVDGSADAPSGQHQRQKVSSATLPVAAVAAALRQFDVRLDAIDIVSGADPRPRQGHPEPGFRLHRRFGDRRVDTAAPPNVLPATSITGASSPSPSTQNLGYMHFPDLPDGGSGAMPRRQRRFRRPDMPLVLVDAPSGPETQWPAMTRFRNPRRDSPVAVT